MTARRTPPQNGDSHWQPRLARLEADVEAINHNLNSLSSTVNELAKSVSNQSSLFGEQVKTLMVAVERAGGPRKTDWQVLISGLTLVLALGMSAGTPMMMQIRDSKTRLDEVVAEVREHHKLPMHPVGESRLGAIERTLNQQIDFNKTSVDALDKRLTNQLALTTETLDKKLNDVIVLGSPITRERLAIIEQKLSIQPAHPNTSNAVP